MKYRGAQYEKDIGILLKLKAHSKKAYSEHLERVITQHSVSYATLYRDLEKASLGKVPGLRKTRSDLGSEKNPATKKEKKIFTELIKSGKKQNKAAEITGELTGKKISSHKLAKLKKDPPEELLQEDPETNFGSEAKKFISKIFQMNLMSPDSVMKFKFKSATLSVTKQEVADIGLILASAYNRSVKGDKQLSVDRFSMLKNELYHSVQEMHRLAKEKGNFKELEACTRMYVRLDSSRAIELPNDFDIYFKCMQRKDPKMTKEEAIDLVLEITSDQNL